MSGGRTFHNSIYPDVSTFRCADATATASVREACNSELNGRQHSWNLTCVNLFVKTIMRLCSFLIPTDWLRNYLATYHHPPTYPTTNQSPNQPVSHTRQRPSWETRSLASLEISYILWNVKVNCHICGSLPLAPIPSCDEEVCVGEKMWSKTLSITTNPCHAFLT